MKKLMSVLIITLFIGSLSILSFAGTSNSASYNDVKQETPKCAKDSMTKKCCAYAKQDSTKQCCKKDKAGCTKSDKPCCKDKAGCKHAKKDCPAKASEKKGSCPKAATTQQK